MAILVNDPYIEEHLLEQRQASGADRYDEVWEDVYMMVPMPNDEHQDIVLGLSVVLHEVVARTGLGKVRPGVNISDRGAEWKQDYRVPDVVVFLNSGRAENLDTHWHGGDFLVEVISPGDRTRQKLPFHDRVGVEELLLIDRRPWKLELYRRAAGKLQKAGQTDTASGEWLRSTAVPLWFRLVAGDPRPQLEIRHTDNDQQWVV